MVFADKCAKIWKHYFSKQFLFHRATKLNTSNWHGGFPSLLRQDGVKETGREAHPMILRKIGFRFWKTATEVQGILLVSLDACGNPTISIIITSNWGFIAAIQPISGKFGDGFSFYHITRSTISTNINDHGWAVKQEESISAVSMQAPVQPPVTPKAGFRRASCCKKNMFFERKSWQKIPCFCWDWIWLKFLKDSEHLIFCCYPLVN